MQLGLRLWCQPITLLPDEVVVAFAAPHDRALKHQVCDRPIYEGKGRSWPYVTVPSCDSPVMGGVAGSPPRPPALALTGAVMLISLIAEWLHTHGFAH